MRDESLISPDIAVLIISLLVTVIMWKTSTVVPSERIPIYVFVIGIAASFTSFGMVYALGRSAKKEAELGEEHSRLLSALESIPHGMIITDTNANILMTNDELGKILGDPGKGGWTLLKLDEKLEDVYSVVSTYREVLDRKHSKASDRVVTNGKELNIYMAPISSSESKEVIGILILITDISAKS